MTQKESQYSNELLISFFLPEGMTEWFEVVKVVEEPNHGTTSVDVLYSHVLNIYMDERDNRSEDQFALKPNGFTETTDIKDYPIRNRKVVLHAHGRAVVLLSRL